ncbi:hypothetical protein CRE_19918 [Caenorhabditis remanei]|uniref:Uncharacterized protein n=1 Tax=Caenorhabditis remanei TaxID=31234 RepID=E3N2Z2_CAERE|nr:hypothetical protein CRE_19918 [Caenorhabditis remanei]
MASPHGELEYSDADCEIRTIPPAKRSIDNDAIGGNRASCSEVKNRGTLSRNIMSPPAAIDYRKNQLLAGLSTRLYGSNMARKRNDTRESHLSTAQSTAFASPATLSHSENAAFLGHRREIEFGTGRIKEAARWKKTTK